MTGNRRIVLVSVLLSSGHIVGCGSSESDPVVRPAQPIAAVPSPAENMTPAVTEDGASERRPDEVWQDEQGRRYLGHVPYDVFFDQPLELAGDLNGPSVTAPVNMVPADENSRGTVAPEPATASDAAATQVSSLPSAVPPEVLESEVKSLRNFLNQKLRSVGTYNSSVTMIPARAATLVLLAEVAAQQQEQPVSWQQDARYVRDLAAAMLTTPLQRGARDQRRLLGLFESLVDTLNRSRPSDLPEPDADIELSDLVEMRLVMKRMEEAEQRLRSEVSEARLSDQLQLVKHEAQLMSGFMQILSSESWGYGDDPDFMVWVKQLQQASDTLQSAAETGQYSDYELALSKLGESCQSCHRDYKND